MALTAAVLRKGHYVGIREVKSKISAFIRKVGFTFITDRGQPKSVLVPYKWLLRFLDEKEDLKEIVEELKNERLLKEIAEGRRNYRRGGWVAAHRLLSKWGH